jgi:DNA-binding response OmpR family regulator
VLKLAPDDVFGQGPVILLYRFADFVLDMERRELRRRPQLVAVTPQAFDLLEYLIINRDRVVSREDLIAAIWEGRIVSETALSTRMSMCHRRPSSGAAPHPYPAPQGRAFHRYRA